MNTRRIVVSLMAVGFLSAATVTVAHAQPVQNIDPNHHPYLATAQRQIADAWGSVSAAQQANQYELGGHVARAKQLLEQAAAELKVAALTANAEGR